MEQKLTNSGPFLESTDKHSIYLPSWSQLAVEWEYDASLPQNCHLIVPARAFFASRDFWWDGRDGYCLVGGRTVFRDPSVTGSGPATLIGDVDDLIARLDKLGLRLIWTLLGEKHILGGIHNEPKPRCTFRESVKLNFPNCRGILQTITDWRSPHGIDRLAQDPLC
jgi:hypothetical protein